MIPRLRLTNQTVEQQAPRINQSFDPVKGKMAVGVI
jgi:hypothetical protein